MTTLREDAWAALTMPVLSLLNYSDFIVSFEAQSLGEEALFVDDTNGLLVGLTYETPKPFMFACSTTANFLEGLTNEAKGMSGLRNTSISLHAQL